MAVVKNKFTDPATGTDYVWLINHSEEDPMEKRRDITRSGKTALTGLTRIQGEESPMVLRLKGTILHASQNQMFWDLWEKCADQTLYFTDFNGEQFEVLITGYVPTRTRVLRNVNDVANMPHHIIKYELELEVIRFISGVLATEGVSP